MIRDAGALPQGAALRADCCVVGAGPAGIAVALAVADAGFTVLMLESGGLRPDARSQSLCEGTLAPGCAHPPPTDYRRRALGGSSTIWGGRCAPLDPLDLQARPWLGLPGWPIAYDTLLPWYAEAAAFAELGAADFDAATSLPGGMRPMLDGFADGAVNTGGIERFSRPTDFGRAHRARLRRHPRIELLLRATACRLVVEPEGAALRDIDAATEAGNRLRITARAVVLAAGGIETPRLLLASGIATEEAGRHYMCHLAGTLGRFTPAPGQRVFHGYERDPDGVYCRRRFAIAAAAQRAAGIGNAIIRLHHPPIADPGHGSAALSALYLCRAALPREYAWRIADGPGQTAAHLANLLRDPGGAARFGARMLFRRLLARRKYPSIIVAPRGGFTLDVHAEQLPDPASRITLGLETDRFGTRLPHIAWRHGARDIATVAGTLRLIGEALRQGGHGTLTWDAAGLEAALLRDGAYGGHHLGTARMGASPRGSVVDQHCRVHGVANLYVAGGAVFATSGQANPTLTILALALRLGDHLGRVLRHRERIHSAPAVLSPPARPPVPHARPFSSAAVHGIEQAQQSPAPRRDR